MQNYHVLIGSIYCMAVVAKLLVHMHGRLLPQKSPRDRLQSLQGDGNTLFDNLFSVLRTQFSKKVKITSENHGKLFY